MNYPLNIPLHYVGRSEALMLAEEWLCTSGSPAHIVTVNPEFLMEARSNGPFCEVLENADMALVDGIGLALALHFSGMPLERMTGVEMTRELATLCARHKKTMALVGGASGIAKKCAESLSALTGVAIVYADEGISIGSTSEAQGDLLRDELIRVHPDVLLVAFGAPRQDMWIADTLSELPFVKIAMGVGGTFDYLSGAQSLAPQWIRRLGLEWLYRLVTQPRRIKRIFTAAVRFPLAILFHR